MCLLSIPSCTCRVGDHYWKVAHECCVALWSFTQELPALIWGHKLLLFFFFWVVWVDWETWLSSCLHWGWGDTSFEWCPASKPEPRAGLGVEASCSCLGTHIVEPSWCTKPVVLMERLFSQNCFVFGCFGLLFTCLIHPSQNPAGNPRCLGLVGSPGATSSYVHSRAQLSEPCRCGESGARQDFIACSKSPVWGWLEW